MNATALRDAHEFMKSLPDFDKSEYYYELPPKRFSWVSEHSNEQDKLYQRDVDSHSSPLMYGRPMISAMEEMHCLWIQKTIFDPPLTSLSSKINAIGWTP